MMQMVDWRATPRHLLMVDDHVMFLQAAQRLLQDQAPRLSIDIVATLAEAIDAVTRARPDLILLDWHLPDADGAAAIARLRECLAHGPMPRIVVLSGDASAAHIHEALARGAAGFIPKSYRFEWLISALGLVLEGGVFLPPEVLGHALPAMASAPPPTSGASGTAAPAAPPMPSPDATATAGLPRVPQLVDLETRFDSLTRRELDVYRAMARGLSNKLIARELNIEESTVKTHLSRVYAELGVSNRTQAVLLASREGFRVA
jgi:DNA-binding NarL/FixJ family response regulator